MFHTLKFKVIDNIGWIVASLALLAATTVPTVAAFLGWSREATLAASLPAPALLAATLLVKLWKRPDSVQPLA
jgi:hypothetical protein